MDTTRASSAHADDTRRDAGSEAIVSASQNQSKLDVESPAEHLRNALLILNVTLQRASHRFYWIEADSIKALQLRIASALAMLEGQADRPGSAEIPAEGREALRVAQIDCLLENEEAP